MMDRFYNRYLSAVIHHPKIVLLAVALVALALAAGLPNFKLDASSDSLTLEHDEDLNFFRETSKMFESGDFLVITFQPYDDLFSEESLAVLRNLQNDLAQVEGVTGVNSILNVPLLYSPKRSLTETVSGVRTLETPGVDKELAKQEFLESPIYEDMILSPDARTTALLLQLQVDRRYIALVQERDGLRLKRDTEGLTPDEEARLEEVSEKFLEYRTEAEQRSRERVARVRDIVAEYQDEARIFVGGVSMITADMISFIQSDLVVFGGTVVVFMIVILAIIFRRPAFIVIPLATCLTAVLMMLGYISWVDWRLTVISSNFVALLLIISLAMIIHLIVRYREFAAQEPEWSQQQLVTETVKFMARPILYTVLTTMVAFASLVVSDIRPVIDFGWMMTIGLMVAFFLAFLIMPASLMLLSRERKKEEKNNVDEPSHPGRLRPLTLYFSRFVENHGTIVIVGALTVAGLSIFGITRLQVENRFIDYFHEETEIYQGLSVIDNKLGGTTTLDIVIEADEDDMALISGEFSNEDADEEDPFAADPFAADDESGGGETNYWMTVAGLERIQTLHEYLEAQPEIGVVQSLATLYEVGRDINGGLNNFELKLMERALPEDVKNVLYTPYISPEDNVTRITMRVKDLYPGLKRAELVERIKDHIREENLFEPENVRFTGLLVLYNNMLQSLFSSQIKTLGLVFLCIFIMFVILFRSLPVSLLAIIPTGLAAISILGFMGLIGLPLDMMTITVAAITVGIGVDNTIHYIYRFKKEITGSSDYIAAMHRSHASIGRAMYYTSVIIIFGFSIMVLSKFIPTIYFGLLTGIAMFAALLGALLLLPKLLLMTKPFK